MTNLRSGMMGLALTGAMAMGTGAFADGMPQRSIKDAPAPFSWTGFYVGGNLGWHGVNTGSTTVLAADAATTAAQCAAAVTPNSLCTSPLGGASGSGAIGGLQAGYNWQFGSAVAGIEADIQGSTAGTTNYLGGNAFIAPLPGGANFGPFNTQTNVNVEWIGTVRARLGFLVSPTFLAYVTGGFAYAGVEKSWGFSIPSVPINTFGRDKSLSTGWTIGGGAEWAVSNRVSIGAEYLYVNLDGGNTFTAHNPAFPLIQNFNVRNGDIDNHIARLKVNFKL